MSFGTKVDSEFDSIVISSVREKELFVNVNRSIIEIQEIAAAALVIVGTKDGGKMVAVS